MGTMLKIDDINVYYGAIHGTSTASDQGDLFHHSGYQ